MAFTKIGEIRTTDDMWMYQSALFYDIEYDSGTNEIRFKNIASPSQNGMFSGMPLYIDVWADSAVIGDSPKSIYVPDAYASNAGFHYGPNVGSPLQIYSSEFNISFPLYKYLMEFAASDTYGYTAAVTLDPYGLGGGVNAAIGNIQYNTQAGVISAGDIVRVDVTVTNSGTMRWHSATCLCTEIPPVYNIGVVTPGNTDTRQLLYTVTNADVSAGSKTFNFTLAITEGLNDQGSAQTGTGAVTLQINEGSGPSEGNGGILLSTNAKIIIKNGKITIKAAPVA